MKEYKDCRVFVVHEMINDIDDVGIEEKINQVLEQLERDKVKFVDIKFTESVNRVTAYIIFRA